MLLIIQVLIIFVLALTLIAIYADEFRNMRRNIPRATMEEVWLTRERRKTVRVKTKLDVLYVHDKKSGRMEKTYTEDISTGGAKINIEEKLEKNTPISLEINLPGVSKPIKIKAKAAWVEDAPRTLDSGKRVFGTGLQFTYIKPSEKEKLSQFVKNTVASQ